MNDQAPTGAPQSAPPTMRDRIRTVILAEAATWTGDNRMAAWTALRNLAARMQIPLTLDECHAAMREAEK